VNNGSDDSTKRGIMKNMRDKKMNKSKKRQLWGLRAKKIANALCRGKDVYFEIDEKTIDGQPAVVFN
jgi:hypothetical protein